MEQKRFTKSIRNEQDFCEFELKDSKYQDLFDFEEYHDIENYVDCNLTLAIDKLGEHEDFEEKIGISLIALCKALTEGWFGKVYYAGKSYHVNWYDGKYAKLEHFTDKDGKDALCLTYPCTDAIYPLNEFGNTWALTKEELK